MPGVEKTDVKIVVEGTTVNIDAEHGEKISCKGSNQTQS